MAEQQLSVRSTRAKKKAHVLAKREQRTVSQIVERALDAYDNQANVQTRENAADFWSRVRREYGLDQGEDFDLDAIIRDGRTPHKPVEF